MFYQRILLLEPPPDRGRAVRRRALNAWRLIPKSKRDIGGNVGRACSTREARFPALLTPPGPPLQALRRVGGSAAPGGQTRDLNCRGGEKLTVHESKRQPGPPRPTGCESKTSLDPPEPNSSPEETTGEGAKPQGFPQ